MRKLKLRDLNVDLKYYNVLGIAFVFWGIGTVWYCVNPNNVTYKLMLTAAWLVIPPIIEFAEFHIVRGIIRSKEYSEYNESTLQDLKDSQEKARYVWAGFAAVLAGLYLKS